MEDLILYLFFLFSVFVIFYWGFRSGVRKALDYFESLDDILVISAENQNDKLIYTYLKSGNFIMFGTKEDFEQYCDKNFDNKTVIVVQK